MVNILIKFICVVSGHNGYSHPVSANVGFLARNFVVSNKLYIFNVKKIDGIYIKHPYIYFNPIIIMNLKCISIKLNWLSGFDPNPKCDFFLYNIQQNLHNRTIQKLGKFSFLGNWAGGACGENSLVKVHDFFG